MSWNFIGLFPFHHRVCLLTYRVGNGFRRVCVKAAACLLASESTKLPEARAQWLAMAQAWNRLTVAAPNSFLGLGHGGSLLMVRSVAESMDTLEREIDDLRDRLIGRFGGQATRYRAVRSRWKVLLGTAACGSRLVHSLPR